MTKFKDGSLFAMPLPEGDWLTGRVLLDMPRVTKAITFTPPAPLARRKAMLLVEIYSTAFSEPSDRTSDVLIPGAWVDPDALKGKDKPVWPVVGFRQVDPATVEFPENVFGTSNIAMFEKGELRLPIRGNANDVERWNANSLVMLPKRFTRVCSHYLGRTDPTEDPDLFSLSSDDLRFNPNREEVMSKMDAPKGSTYFEWAKSLGIDPTRLWA